MNAPSHDTPLVQAALSVPAFFEDLLVDEPQLLAEIVQLFVADATANLALLSEHISLRDETAMSMTFHALKGSCRQIGGLTMGHILERMEASLSKDGVQAACQFVESLDSEFQRLRLGLQELLNKSTERRPIAKSL